MIEIYVINLKEREDRKEKLLELFSKYKNINLNFVEAIKYKRGIVGCFLSHKKCLNIAKNKKLDYIIVIEDDCVPLENFEERLILVLEFLEKNINSWDIFLGGVNATKLSEVKKKITYKDNNFYEISRGTCAHLIIYNKSSYNFFTSKDVHTEFNDTCWWNKLRAYVTIPFLAHQMAGYSNIQNQMEDYTNQFDRTENIISKFEEPKKD